MASEDKVSGWLRGHKGVVTALHCAEYDGVVWLASGGSDGCVRVWDVRTGKCVRMVMARGGDKDAATSSTGIGTVCLSPNLTELVCSIGLTLFWFDLSSPMVVLRDAAHTTTLPGLPREETTQGDEEEDEVNDLSFHASGEGAGWGEVMVAADDTGAVTLLRLSSTTPTRVDDVQVLHARTSEEEHPLCTAVCLRPETKAHLLSGGLDSFVVLWDVQSGNALKRFNMAEADRQVSGNAALPAMFNPPWVYCVDVHAYGRLAAVGLGSGKVLLLDLVNNEVLDVHLPAHAALVSSVRFVEFSPHLLLTAGVDCELAVWDVRTLLPKSAHKLLERRKKNKKKKKKKKGKGKVQEEEEEDEEVQEVSVRRFKLPGKPSALECCQADEGVVSVYVAMPRAEVAVVRFGL